MHHRTQAMTRVLLSSMLMLGAAAGCASRATRTERTVTIEAPAAAVDTDETPPRRAADTTVTTTTTTTTDSDKRSPGIIGSAFGLVWAVVSFPFRVIAALF